MSIGINNIEVMSGTAEDVVADGVVTYRGFVTVIVSHDSGDETMGQLSIEECRQLGLHFLEVAEAAEQDAMIFRVLVNKVGMPVQNVAPLVESLRDERGTLTGPKVVPDGL